MKMGVAKIPEWCVSMRCIDCQSHAIIGGKIDCNYLNRLGLSQPTVKTFLDDAGAPEKVKAKLADAKKRSEDLRAEIERLEKIKAGGEESG